MAKSPKQQFVELDPHRQRRFVEQLDTTQLHGILRGDWWWTARPEQQQPPGDYLIWLVLSGRGWGKTRTAAEWIVERSVRHPVDESGAPTERLVVGETIADVRNVLIGGPSGILRVLDRINIKYRYYKSPKPLIRLLDSGCIIHGVGAENGDVGRGFNLADVIMDEFAKWPFPRESWFEGIMPALRVHLPGDHPRALVTTTPKPLELLREWRSRTDGSVHVVSGSTFENSDNLSPLVLAALRTEYEGTSLGQQELYGVILDDAAGRLFGQADINLARVHVAPQLVDIVVGVDPCLTGEEDEMGVVVVGRDELHHWYVLADASILGAGKAAAAHCWNVFFEYGASRIVVESNLGKKWMIEAFSDAYREIVRERGLRASASLVAPIEPVQSMAGKKLRAEPVGHRCEGGRLHMVGTFAKLEGQCVDYDPATAKDSPDRLDALVHACRYHMSQEPQIQTITTPPRRIPINRRLNPLGRTEDDQYPW